MYVWALLNEKLKTMKTLEKQLDSITEIDSKPFYNNCGWSIIPVAIPPINFVIDWGEHSGQARVVSLLDVAVNGEQRYGIQYGQDMRFYMSLERDELIKSAR